MMFFLQAAHPLLWISWDWFRSFRCPVSFAKCSFYKRLTRCFGLAGMGLKASGVPADVKHIIASMRDEPQNLDGRRAEALRWSSVAQQF